MNTIKPSPLSVTPPPNDAQDPTLYRILISGLVAAVILTVIAVPLLAAFDKTTPEGLIAIGSACVGGLVGLLVPSPVK
jgi:hypothetical protein